MHMKYNKEQMRIDAMRYQLKDTKGCSTEFFHSGNKNQNKQPTTQQRMTDTEIVEWMERNPLAITATAVIKSWGRKNWWQTAYGDFETLREAVERCHKERPSS